MYRIRLQPWLVLLMPAFVVLLAVIAIPLVLSLYSSFTAFQLTRPESITKWIGTFNYQKAMGDANFWSAFGRTILLLTIALNLEMLLGLGLALLVDKGDLRGQRALAHHHDVSDDVLADPGGLSVQVHLQRQCRAGEQRPAVAGPDQHRHSVAGGWQSGHVSPSSVAEVWTSTSVFAILILAGLFAMPRDPLEAARVDGCTPWQTFRYVTLPFLMPFIYIAMTIRSLDVARAYDIVQIMTEWRAGPPDRAVVDADRANRLCRCQDGLCQCHGLYLHSRRHCLYGLFLPQAQRLAHRAGHGGLSMDTDPYPSHPAAAC